MGLEFEKLKFEHLGANAEDGVSVLDEVQAKIDELAPLVMNDMFDGKASIDIKLRLERTREEGLVVYADVTEKRPSRRRVGRSCFVSEGEVLVEKAMQLPLPGVRTKKRVERDGIEEEHAD